VWQKGYQGYQDSAGIGKPGGDGGGGGRENRCVALKIWQKSRNVKQPAKILSCACCMLQ